MLDLKWTNIVKKLDFAMQPIVSSATGYLYGVEVLLRNVREAGGYYSIFNCFDDAFDDGVLYQFDIELRKLAFEKFKKLDHDNLTLFYNLDSRLMYMPDYKAGNTQKILHKLNLDKSDICYEVSERGSLKDPSAIKNLIQTYKNEDFEIALDDYGTGISGLQLLYFSEPDFIKIDRFFIKEIENDMRKKHFCHSIINMAHSMGIKVIAEGIETKKEYYVCKEVGADYVQGYFIQEPTTDSDKIEEKYDDIIALNKADKRYKENSLINKKYIETGIEPLKEDVSMHELFLYFKQNPQRSFVPIVNRHYNLVGVIHEIDIKKISYSQYGLALAKNDSFGAKLSNYIRPAASVELSWGIDKTLEIYNLDKESNKGIFVTKDNHYYGFIHVNSLLSLSYKRNIQIAQNQNPLTKLPGNESIEQHLASIYENGSKRHHLVYFDFNDFKPFNDSYGFRQGDRAILMFAEILRKGLPAEVFKAHVGGDDFFIAFEDFDYHDVYALVSAIREKFKNSVSSLYKQKDRNNGYLKSKDRFGTSRKFNLLDVAAAIIEIDSKTVNDLKFDDSLGMIKKSAKGSPRPIGVSIL